MNARPGFVLYSQGASQGLSRWPSRWLLCALLALSALLPVRAAWADARVWLDRDRIALDETVTLHAEADAGRLSSLPDPYLLGRDFRVLDQESQQQVEVVNGQVRVGIKMRYVLQPLHEGEIVIPTYEFGVRNDSLRLFVLPARQRPAEPAAPAEERAVFLETAVETDSAYVQQTVGYVVRLYFMPATLLDGNLEQDPPEGASLQQVGDIQEYAQTIGGRTYRVAERRYLLIPERPGPLKIPGAKFEGRSIGGLFGEFLGDTRGDTHLSTEPRTLQVKPLPANAPQPWLPLRGLRLRYLDAPRGARVGEAVEVVVEAVADGASAAQLPQLRLGDGSDAQVFAEPVQTHERFVDGRPQVMATRTFSVVPTRVGGLRIVGPRLNWWDADAGVARVASLPDLQLRVGPGAVAQTVANDDAAGAGGARSWLPSHLASGPWRWAGITLGLMWLGALAWGWRLWSGRNASARPANARTGATPKHSAPPSLRPADAEALRRALAGGDLGIIARTLCAMATPPVDGLLTLRERLDDSAQRAAVDQLQLARWGGGDTQAARAAVRAAFAAGPRWRVQASPAAPLLPPLYPEH